MDVYSMHVFTVCLSVYKYIYVYVSRQILTCRCMCIHSQQSLCMYIYIYIKLIKGKPLSITAHLAYLRPHNCLYIHLDTNRICVIYPLFIVFCFILVVLSICGVSRYIYCHGEVIETPTIQQEDEHPRLHCTPYHKATDVAATCDGRCVHSLLSYGIPHLQQPST